MSDPSGRLRNLAGLSGLLLRRTLPAPEDHHENRPDRPARRERPAALLRRHRARRFLPDRGTGPTGPRRDAVRQRRFGHRGATRSLRADGRCASTRMCATRCRIICRCSSGCGSTRGEFDILHFHIDLMQFPMLRTICDAGGHHAARPARSARPAAVLPSAFPTMPLVSISDRPARGRCRRSTGSARSITACRADLYRVQPARRRGRLSRLSRPHLAGEASRPGDRDRQRAPACG